MQDTTQLTQDDICKLKLQEIKTVDSTNFQDYLRSLDAYDAAAYATAKTKAHGTMCTIIRERAVCPVR